MAQAKKFRFKPNGATDRVIVCGEKAARRFRTRGLEEIRTPPKPKGDQDAGPAAAPGGTGDKS